MERPYVLGHKILQDLIQNDSGDSSMGIDKVQLGYSWETVGWFGSIQEIKSKIKNFMTISWL